MPVEFTTKQINLAVTKALSKAEEGIEYDKLMLLRIAFYKKFKLDFKNLSSENKDICSEFARRYTNYLGAKCYSKETIGLDFITPQDFIRYMDRDKFELISEKVK